MPFDFTGKKRLVTGAGRGVDRAVVKALVAAGGEVYALSVTKENLDSLVEELPTVHPIQVDLADWEATRREVDKLGPLDGLVNNAGVTCKPTFCLDVKREDIERITNINLFSAINVSQSVGKKMVEAGTGGSIVNVGSIAGLGAMQQMLAYSCGKAGLDMATKQFATELGPYNIRVNAVHPFVTVTDMTRPYLANTEWVEGMLARTPMGRFTEMRENVDPILYLLSDHSSAVTGTMNRLDCGMLCKFAFALCELKEIEYEEGNGEEAFYMGDRD